MLVSFCAAELSTRDLRLCSCSHGFVRQMSKVHSLGCTLFEGAQLCRDTCSSHSTYFEDAPRIGNRYFPKSATQQLCMSPFLLID